MHDFVKIKQADGNTVLINFSTVTSINCFKKNKEIKVDVFYVNGVKYQLLLSNESFQEMLSKLNKNKFYDMSDVINVDRYEV